jgi:serine protease Do
MIASIEKDSPAAKAGLMAGDLMVKWNGTAVRDETGLIQMIQDTPIGSKADIEVLRQGKTAKLTATIEARRPQDPSERLVIDVQDALALPGAQIAARDGKLQSSLGIDMVSLTSQLADFLQLPGETGLLVASVNKEGTFARAGIVAGDVILSVDGISVSSPQVFYDHVDLRGWGSRLVMRLMRKGKQLSIPVQLPKAPGSSRKHQR